MRALTFELATNWSIDFSANRKNKTNAKRKTTVLIHNSYKKKLIGALAQKQSAAVNTEKKNHSNQLHANFFKNATNFGDLHINIPSISFSVRLPFKYFPAAFWFLILFLLKCFLDLLLPASMGTSPNTLPDIKLRLITTCPAGHINQTHKICW